MQDIMSRAKELGALYEKALHEQQDAWEAFEERWGNKALSVWQENCVEIEEALDAMRALLRTLIDATKEYDTFLEQHSGDVKAEGSHP